LDLKDRRVTRATPDRLVLLGLKVHRDQRVIKATREILDLLALVARLVRQVQQDLRGLQPI